MMYAPIFIFLIMILLNSLFKIASIIRFGIPSLYVFVVPIFFPDWLHEHDTLATGILFAMLGFVVLSWIVTIRRKLRHRWEQKQHDTGISGR